MIQVGISTGATFTSLKFFMKYQCSHVRFPAEDVTEECSGRVGFANEQHINALSHHLQAALR